METNHPAELLFRAESERRQISPEIHLLKNEPPWPYPAPQEGETCAGCAVAFAAYETLEGMIMGRHQSTAARHGF